MFPCPTCEKDTEITQVQKQDGTREVTCLECKTTFELLPMDDTRSLFTRLTSSMPHMSADQRRDAAATLRAKLPAAVEEDRGTIREVARDLLDSKEWELAIDVLGALRAVSEEKDPLVWTGLAAAHSQLGDYHRAIQVLQETLESDPTDALVQGQLEVMRQNMQNSTLGINQARTLAAFLEESETPSAYTEIVKLYLRLAVQTSSRCFAEIACSYAHRGFKRFPTEIPIIEGVIVAASENRDSQLEDEAIRKLESLDPQSELLKIIRRERREDG